MLKLLYLLKVIYNYQTFQNKNAISARMALKQLGRLFVSSVHRLICINVVKSRAFIDDSHKGIMLLIDLLFVKTSGPGGMDKGNIKTITYKTC